MAGTPNIVITGPTGWIGQAFTARIAAKLGQGWDSRVKLFGSYGRSWTAPSGETVEIRPLDGLTPNDVDGAIVLHLAFLGRERTSHIPAATYFQSNFQIDEVVLQACREGSPRGVFVSSSGAAMGVQTGEDRNAYGVCKIVQEDRFLELGEGGVPTFVGRIFNVAGPHINKVRSYAISSFALGAIEERRIEIKATVPTFRSFLHVYDLVELVLAKLESDTKLAGRVFDLCGTELVEMSELAARVADVIGLSPNAIIRPPLNDITPRIYAGQSADTQTLALTLGLRLKPLDLQVRDTIDAVVEQLSRE